MSDLALRRKLTFRAHGSSLVLIKRPIESTEHVLQKALLWALYLPLYPALRVEVPLAGSARYKPDLLAVEDTRPVFWGECGVVSTAKLSELLQRYRATHFCFSKWDTPIQPFITLIERALKGSRRSAPVELICFPGNAARAISDDGTISIGRADVELRRWD